MEKAKIRVIIELKKWRAAASDSTRISTNKPSPDMTVYEQSNQPRIINEPMGLA